MPDTELADIDPVRPNSYTMDGSHQGARGGP